MSIRMSGLVSGMDTEEIVKQLMEAHKMKKTKVDNKKTKLEWTQTKWQELNTKIYSLYTDSVSKMRLQSSYKAKKVASGNEAKLTATASTSAPTGTNTVSVDKLASSQYVTGANISSLGLKSTSKLTDIVDENGNSKIEAGTVFNITVGTGDKAKESSFTVKEDSTIADFVGALKNAGLSASFDEKQGRFFISSVDSGQENAFTLTSTSLTQDAVDGRKAIEDALDYSKLSSADKATVNSSYQKISSGTYKEKYEATNALLDIAEKNTRTSVKADATEYVKSMYREAVMADTDEMDKIRQEQTEAVTDDMVAKAVKDKYTADARKEIEDELDAQISSGEITLVDDSHREVLLAERIKNDLDSKVQAKLDDTTAYEADLESTKTEKIDELVNKAVDAKVSEKVKSEQGQAQIDYLVNNGLSSESMASAVEQGVFSQEQSELVEINSDNSFDDVEAQVAVARSNLQDLVDDYASNAETSGSRTGALSALGLGEITGQSVNGGTTGMTVVAAADSQITLNGAILTGSSNSFTANGITFDLKSVTAPGETIQINVTNDVDATYNMVKDFLKSYNGILKELNTLYDAPSAKGYDPLTDDEKEAMTDDQIEKWETKIKDSLLRNDSTLGSLISAMRSAMSSSVEVDGKKYSLSSYGIMTSSDYTEKGLLHIYGDADDSVYSSNADKLKKALTEDPDTVVEVLSGVSKKLYETMQDKMKTSSQSSALTFYNDKKIKKDLKNYSDEISKWEKKLQDMEDRYYKQFSAMEKALSNMNSQSSYLSGLFGTGQ